MMRILVIDDDKVVLASLEQTFDEEFADVEFRGELDLHEGFREVSLFRPDVVVLDLRRGPVGSDLAGQRTWSDIWESRFCPVAIYTAVGDDLDPPIPDDHPFVKRVTKGRDAEAKLVEVIRGFLPGVEAIESLRSELDSVIHQVLRDTAGTFVDPVNKDHLLHAGRRRVAASMDDPTLASDRKLTSWEQYLLPAIGDSPLTADLLRKHGARCDEPTAYRLVLTPSCDLVKGRNEPTLIVAHCEGTTQLVKKLTLSLKENRRDKDVENVNTKVLSAGVFAGLLPLPPFPNHLPMMVANLKNLEVILYEAIGRTESTQPSFERVASIDSPFREQVAWAFLTTIARPGMPDRDLKSWAVEIVQDAAKAVAPAPPAPPQ